ncbi:MAG: flagellar basal body-associated FliL family protein [Myxococcota bacterium]
MADDDDDDLDENDEGKKAKGGPGIVGILLPGVLAAGGAFGGAFFAGGAAPAADEPTEEQSDMPGPTVPLLPFVINIQDTEGQVHPMKLTLAIELAAGTDPSTFELFVPRIRDTCITYLRSLDYTDAADSKSKERMVGDLLAQIHKLGAEMAVGVLVQDYVIQ